ncbi:hypothetical protein Taro_023358, partial [Colocasia esculenta]|nr:hypothetical protein [Colocasia esculenta]
AEGAQVHACAVKLGAAVDTYVQNTLIQLYFSCGNSLIARQLFDGMPNRSVVTWNCVIAGYAELGFWEDVKSLFWLMIEEFALESPNSVALVRMLTACTRSGDFEMGKRVHKYMVHNAVDMSLNLANALMNMYAKFGKMDEALMLFRAMPNWDVVSWATLINGYMGIGRFEIARELFDDMPERNIVAWNTMISGYVLNRRFRDALLLFKEMMVLDVKVDHATFICVLTACARSGDFILGSLVHGYIYKFGMEMTLELIHSLLCLYVKCGSMESGERLFKKMTIRNEISWTLMMEGYVRCGKKDIAIEMFNQIPYKDVASWNALITTLCQNNFYKDALDIFEEMLILNVAPNQVTLVSALSACARVGVLALGTWIHAYIDRNKIEMDCHLSSALIDMYAKCGCVDLSLKVFNDMPIKDLLAWSTMIGGLAMHGHANHALVLFREMIDDGLQPDGVTFLGVLVACCHAGLVDEGRHFFALMTQVYGISPTTEHCSCMVDLYGRRGLLSEAKDFIKNVISLPDAGSIWGTLLSACVNHGNIELAECAMNQLLEIDPKNSGAYVLLSNVYAKASKWDNVRKVRNMMKENGVRKIPGCSSIEVNGVVHEFFVGDASHLQCEKIYTTSDKLETQLEEA